jgi:glycerophosphoryl diester phosphodiesterase
MAFSITPLIIAHRGERILSPENTITAGKLALQQGATGLEIDVRMCRSGEPVLLHDANLMKHFGKPKPVALCTLQELKSLHFRKNHYTYPDQICTLEEFLEEFRGTVPLNLDAKSIIHNPRHFAQTLVRLIDRLKIHDQVWISSFNPYLLRKIKKITPRIRTGYLFQNPPRLHELIEIFLSSDAWHPHYKNVNDAFVRRALKMKKEIYIWTVNEESILKKIKHYDFNGIITDTFFRNASYLGV